MLKLGKIVNITADPNSDRLENFEREDGKEMASNITLSELAQVMDKHYCLRP